MYSAVHQDDLLQNAIVAINDHLHCDAVLAYMIDEQAGGLTLIASTWGMGHSLRPLSQVSMESLRPLLSDVQRGDQAVVASANLFLEPSTQDAIGGSYCVCLNLAWRHPSDGLISVFPLSKPPFSPGELRSIQREVHAANLKIQTDHLLRSYQETADIAIRNQLVMMHMGTVERICQRYEHYLEPLDDLRQVAALALIGAIDRFNREKGWAVKVPRRLKQLSREVQQQADQFYSRHGRHPTVEELAHSLQTSAELVQEAMRISAGWRAVHLNTVAIDSLDEARWNRLTETEPSLDGLSDRLALLEGIKRLDKREQAVILMRFYRGLSQSRVATRLGISQVHVSRIERQALAKLRQFLTTDEGLRREVNAQYALPYSFSITI